MLSIFLLGIVMAFVFFMTLTYVIESFKTVLSHKVAIKSMLVLGFSFGGFFIIVAKTSFIYIEYFKIQTDYFPFFFGINFIVLIVMIKVNVNLLKKINPVSLVKIALLVQVIAGILFVLNY